MKYKIDDVTYSYDIAGEGEAVLLLHGFTGTKATWKALKEKLVPQFQVITIDLPGHGESSNTPVTMEQCVEHLSQFFRQINVERAHIIGYSMGGRVALSFAMNFSRQVKSLILESSSPGLEMEAERKARKESDKQLAEKIVHEGIESFVQYWENIPLFHTQKSLDDNVSQSIRKERLSQDVIGLANSLRFMGTGSQPSWWKSLGECGVSTLLIVGELDKKFVELNRQMKALMPKAQMEVVKDCGHAVHIERPGKFQQIVQAFLARN